jgi:hypothetical protein
MDSVKRQPRWLDLWALVISGDEVNTMQNGSSQNEVVNENEQ